MKKRYFGKGTLSLLLALVGIVWSFTFFGVCIGDNILNIIGLKAWTNGDAGTHLTVYYSLIFFIPAILLGIKYKSDWGSKVGKVLSVIMVVFLAVATIFGAGGGALVGCVNIVKNSTQNTLADSLYQYKNTPIDDHNKFSEMFNLLPDDNGLEKKGISSPAPNSHYAVHYNIDDRKTMREKMGEYELAIKRNAAIMFALITDMESLTVYINDQYSDPPRSNFAVVDGFASYYIPFENLNESFGTDYFTKENLKTAVASKGNFRKFVDKVMAMDSPYNKDVPNQFKAIYNVIGEGWEVMVNSGTGAIFVLKENVVVGGFDLAKVAKENNIDITEYYGKEIYVQTNRITNYAGQEPDTSYAFVFYNDELIAYKNIGTDENAITLAKYCYEIERNQNNY